MAWTYRWSIPKSYSVRACAARARCKRVLRQVGVFLAPDATTHDILAFWQLPAVRDKIKRLKQKEGKK